jgi:hypothetical protein
MCSFQALERATPLNDDNLNLREVLDDFNVETALYLVGTIYVLFTLYTKSIKFLLGSNTAPTPLGARTARLLPFFRSLFLVFAMAYVGLQNFKERKSEFVGLVWTRLRFYQDAHLVALLMHSQTSGAFTPEKTSHRSEEADDKLQKFLWAREQYAT